MYVVPVTKLVLNVNSTLLINVLNAKKTDISYMMTVTTSNKLQNLKEEES